MAYLDYHKFLADLSRYFPCEADRLVGPERIVDSSYTDIVRFFGPNAVDPAQVAIIREPRPFVLNDPKIVTYASWAAAKMRAEGRLTRGPAALNVVTLNLSRMVMVANECDYDLQAGTCFALDHEHPLFADDGGSLRLYYLDHYRSRSLEDSPLPQCLGVCGLLLAGTSAAEALLVVRRLGNLASLENSIGPSAAGSVDFAALDKNLARTAARAMVAEIIEELPLGESEFKLRPLAFAREPFRGEKPQVFYLIASALTTEEIDNRLRDWACERREFDDWYWLPLKPTTGVGHPATPALNHEASMNFHLIREFRV